MKVVFIALCLVAGAFARSAVQQDLLAEGPRCPIADPLNAPGPVPINASLLPIFEIALGSQVTNLVAEGLSTLHYKVEMNVLIITATFELTLERATGNATYTASGIIDASPISDDVIPSGEFTGNGLGKVSVEGFHVAGRAQLFISDIGKKVSIRTLNIEALNFDSLSVDFGAEWRIGGKPVDWVAFNAQIRDGFFREWEAKKAEIIEKFRAAADNLVGQYTLYDFIELIGGGGGSKPCPTPAPAH